MLQHRHPGCHTDKRPAKPGRDGDTWQRTQFVSRIFHCGADHARKDCAKFLIVLENADSKKGKPDGKWNIPPGEKGEYDKQRAAVRNQNTDPEAKHKGGRVTYRNDGGDTESDGESDHYTDSENERPSSGSTKLGALDNFKLVENGVPMKQATIDRPREQYREHERQ